MTNQDAFSKVQSLTTTGARAMTPFVLDDTTYLAVPQLAADNPGEPPYMNGGNSDIPLKIFRWNGSAFVDWIDLPVPGGEDAEFFEIGSRKFLATASLRSGGKAPYELNVISTLYEWDGEAFEPFQQFETYAAKQWRYFEIGGRHFLALAQGVVIEGETPRHPHESMIFEWDGDQFVPFQTVPSAWGYNWLHFKIGGDEFLAYADHKTPSILMRWNGAAFEHFQTLDGASGRAFSFFEEEAVSYLAFANLLGDTVLLKWDGADFKSAQTLSGPGGREFATFRKADRRYLVQVNFLTGSPKAPVTNLTSTLYVLENGLLKVAATFPTNGAPDVAAFEIDGETMIAVAESLSPEVRFGTDSHIYKFTTN